LDPWSALPTLPSARRAEQRLRETEPFFRSLLESAPDALMVVDHHGVIQLTNAQTEKVFGYTRNELVGQRVEMLVPESVQGGHAALRASFHGIAHDFNNLFSAVSAQAELAVAQTGTGSYPTQELKHIRDITIRGAEIVRQLMIYAGQKSDVLEPVDLTKTVEEMLPLLTVCVSGCATLLTDFDKNLPAIKAPAAQIRRIVRNLVVNASDAIQDHDGVIRVTTLTVTRRAKRLG